MATTKKGSSNAAKGVKVRDLNAKKDAKGGGHGLNRNAMERNHGGLRTAGN